MRRYITGTSDVNDANTTAKTKTVRWDTSVVDRNQLKMSDSRPSDRPKSSVITDSFINNDEYDSEYDEEYGSEYDSEYYDEDDESYPLESKISHNVSRSNV